MKKIMVFLATGIFALSLSACDGGGSSNKATLNLTVSGNPGTTGTLLVALFDTNYRVENERTNPNKAGVAPDYDGTSTPVAITGITPGDYYIIGTIDTTGTYFDPCGEYYFIYNDSDMDGDSDVDDDVLEHADVLTSGSAIPNVTFAENEVKNLSVDYGTTQYDPCALK